MNTPDQQGWLPPGSDLYRAVMEQGPDAVIFADREGVIRLWNLRAEEIFGYTAGEAVGMSLDLIIPPHLRDAHWRGYGQAIASGRTRLHGKAMVTRATHKDGSKLYVEFAFGIVSDPKEGVLGALATARAAAKP
jgi:PAS domain S-box-containing protein